MEILRIPGTTRELGKPKDWDESKGPCATLPIADTTINGAPFMLSMYEPTPDELALLNLGCKIILGIQGTNHPGCFLSVSEPEPTQQMDI